MECPICFNEYNEDLCLPVKTFCRCQQTLCKACLEQLLIVSTYCPWDKTRWSGRNLIKKFLGNTPKNYLETRKKIHQEESKEKSSSSSITRKTDELTQYEKDKLLAFQLQEELTRNYLNQQHLQEEEDFKLASELSKHAFSPNQTSSSDSQIDYHTSIVNSSANSRKRNISDFLQSQNEQQRNTTNIFQSAPHPLNICSTTAAKHGRIDFFLIQQHKKRKPVERNSTSSECHSSPNSTDSEIAWVCRICSYENVPRALRCEVCGE
jgi:hypothetical protein